MSFNAIRENFLIYIKKGTKISHICLSMTKSIINKDSDDPEHLPRKKPNGHLLLQHNAKTLTRLCRYPD